MFRLDRYREPERRTWKPPRWRNPVIAVELALLLLLATLWGASYTFIKLGVATIPPITLIAARTSIAGALLLVIMRWRGIGMPRDATTWRRFLFQACLNSVVPWTLIAWGERFVDAGLATILNSASPIFTFLFTIAVTRHEAVGFRKLFGRVRGHGRHLPDRRRSTPFGTPAANSRPRLRSSSPRFATRARPSSAAGSRASIRWRRRQARYCQARRS